MLPRDFPPWQTVYWYFTLWRQHPKQRSAGIDDLRPLSARIRRVMRAVAADLRRSRRVSAGGRRTAPKPLTEREIGPECGPARPSVARSAKPSDARIHRAVSVSASPTAETSCSCVRPPAPVRFASPRWAPLRLALWSRADPRFACGAGRRSGSPRLGSPRRAERRSGPPCGNRRRSGSPYREWRRSGSPDRATTSGAAGPRSARCLRGHGLRLLRRHPQRSLRLPAARHHPI
jgi:hypothetical protein